MFNVSIEKNDKESDSVFLRRFSKLTQSYGIVAESKKRMYYERMPSKGTRRKQKLLRLKKTSVYEKLYRLGKLPERQQHRRYR